MNKYVLIPHEKYTHLMRNAGPVSVRHSSDDLSPNTIVEPTLNEHKGMTVESIVAVMPKNARNRARALLEVIEKHILWNDRGEIIYNGKPIARSHIADLVKQTVVKHFTKKKIIGGREYFDMLSEINVPRSLILNDLERHPDVARQPDVAWHGL